MLAINKNKHLYKMELVKGGVRVTKSYKVGFEVLQSTDINWNITTSLLIGNKINNLPDNGGGKCAYL